MEFSSILIGVLLFVASLAFVSLPFRRRNVNLKLRKADGQGNHRREAVLSALRDLEFDFRTGKVGEEDYTPLRTQLMTEAAHYIEREKEEEEKLEALIQSRRTVQVQISSCEHCGAPVESGQRFCSKCGSAVHQELCPSCGQKIRAGDQFCSTCGGRLGVVAEAVAQS